MSFPAEERASLRREILRQAWPVVVQNLLHTAMFYLDNYMIGGLGPDALAAMGVVGPVQHTLTTVLAALSVGAVATVARAWGEGDRDKQRREASAALALGLVLGIPLSIAGWFVLPSLAGFFRIPGAPEVEGLAAGYLRIQGASLGFYCLYLAGAGILRGAGQTRFATAATFGAIAVNVALNWVFIYGNLGAPRMGVAGASLATACGLAFESLLVAGFLVTPFSPIRLTPASLRGVTRESLARLMRVSLPAAAEPAILQTGFLVYNKAITLLGPAAMAAHRAAITVESLTFMPGFGFAVAGSAVVGQFLGAGRPDRAQAALHEAARLSTYFMSAIGVLFLFAGAPLARIFLPGSDAALPVAMAALCLAISAFEQPFMALAMAFAGGLRGAGDMKSPLIVGVLGVWGVRVPLAWALAFPLGFGLPGIWATMVVDWALRAAVTGALWRRGRWKSIRL